LEGASLSYGKKEGEAVLQKKKNKWLEGKLVVVVIQAIRT